MGHVAWMAKVGSA